MVLEKSYLVWQKGIVNDKPGNDKRINTESIEKHEKMIMVEPENIF